MCLFGDGAFREVIRVTWDHKGGGVPSVVGLVPLQEEEERHVCLSTTWGHSERVAICEPGREIFPEELTSLSQRGPLAKVCSLQNGGNMSFFVRATQAVGPAYGVFADPHGWLHSVSNGVHSFFGGYNLKT